MMPTGAESSGRLVLDTSAYSWLRTGHGSLLQLLASADLVAVPTVVLGELEAGFLLGNRLKENRELLDQFLGEPFVSILPVTREVSQIYGQLYAELRRGGTPIPLNDIWIAACTIAAGGRLLTFDGHFQLVQGLTATVFGPPIG